MNTIFITERAVFSELQMIIYFVIIVVEFSNLQTVAVWYWIKITNKAQTGV